MKVGDPEWVDANQKIHDAVADWIYAQLCEMSGSVIDTPRQFNDALDRHSEALWLKWDDMHFSRGKAL